MGDDEVDDNNGNRIIEEYVRRAVEDVHTKVGRSRPYYGSLGVVRWVGVGGR